MIRATTPTHTFTFPDAISNYSEVVITYVQNEQTILEKHKADLTVSGSTVSFTFTQQESLAFAENADVKVQIKAKRTNNIVVASQIFKMKVAEILNDEVL